MYVSPQKASFKKSMRGYKARQVDAYIETLCSEFAGAEEDYQTRILAMEKEIAQLRAELAECQAIKQEYERLLSEQEQLRKRRFRLRRPVPSTEAEQGSQTEEQDKPVVSVQQKEERVRHFFRVSADVVRLIGHTGKRVGKVLAALPEPTPATGAAAAAAASKKAEQAKRKQLRDRKKSDKKQQKQERKAQKLDKKEEKQG